MKFRRFVQTIVRNGNALTVALPRPLLFELGLRRGDPVNVAQCGRSILVTPVGDAVRDRVAADVVHVAAVEAELKS